MSFRILLNPRLLYVVRCGDILQTNSPLYNSSRFIQKHWDPKYKKLRAAKFIKVDLPNYEDTKKSYDEFTEEEIRTKMKEQGIKPEYPHIEKPMFISSTGEVFEAYVPPEGDGKVSPISKEGAKQTWEFVEKKGKSMLAVRKIRNFDEDFEVRDFLNLAQDVYIKAHETMANRDKELLQQYVTEKAYPEAVYNIDRKTIHWKFLQSIEPPRMVHARTTSIITKDNVFGQLTVRFHTQQVLAVYDRFGRLIHGSEILAKDVLEYIVFEKHLSNQYGTWRIHAKIIPDWKPLPEPGRMTYVVEKEQSSDSKGVSTVPDDLKRSKEPPSVPNDIKPVASPSGTAKTVEFL
ncbi:mitochondrial ribosomal protein L45 [Lycorma delicatula]|uniref:mitochondrial ribosomal protein L45 n=1 Tax=Lycorma delicatula TaxID=130591 RepID=UPI003F50EA11